MCVALVHVASLTEEMAARSIAYHMEQLTVTISAVIHGLCAMTVIKSAMHCSLRLAPTMIHVNHLTSTCKY